MLFLLLGLCLPFAHAQVDSRLLPTPVPSVSPIPSVSPVPSVTPVKPITTLPLSTPIPRPVEYIPQQAPVIQPPK